MLKIALNKLKTKPTTLKFLYEIAAIPTATREEFLKKLLKRKNAGQQKNVQLLKIIYECIENDTKLEWDDNNICTKLNISKDMLYCHKSWILKGLREHYFNWREIEKERFGTSEENNIEILFEKAELMQKIGMKKEARSIFFKMIKLLNKKKKNKTEYIILFKSLAHLSSHYSRIKNFTKFNLYFKKIQKLGNYIIKTIPQEKSLIKTKLYINSAFKVFNANKTTPVLESMKFMVLALKETQKTKDYMQSLTILHNLINTYNTIKRFDKSLYFLNQGIQISKKHHLKHIHYYFKLEKSKVLFETGDISKEVLLERIKDLINNLHYSDNDARWKKIILYDIIQSASYIGEDTVLNKYIYEYNSQEIIYNELDSALRSLYFMKWHSYFGKINDVRIKYIDDNKEYLIVYEANKEFLKKIDNSILELMVNSKKIQDVFFRKEFFTVMLLVDFWKGKNCSSEYSSHIYKQIEWLNKTRPMLKDLNEVLIENSYLGINMMSDLSHLTPDDFLKKYEQKFKQHCDLISEAHSVNELGAYYMFSFIANQCEFDELKEIVKNTFFKLKSKHPESINKFIKEVEENQNSKITTHAA